MSVITIRDLRVTRGGGDICRVASLSLSSGERLSVTGANGTGKTTLLRVLAGLERDFEGLCTIDLPPLSATLVHQQPYLLRMSVCANVMYGLVARGATRGRARRLAQDWLERLGVARLAERHAVDLSGGEIKRIALARALAIEPRLLLLDEPYGELDDDGADLVREVLESLTDVTLVISEPATREDAVEGWSVLFLANGNEAAQS